MSFKTRIIGIIGNIFEHYDSALFGLLAPFIASLFFETEDPVTALILTYGMLPLGILFRPLGSLFFGWIGDHWGRRQALFFSLTGMACATVLMGCLPTYATAGIYAPLSLALCRILQNFCVAGESVGGAIFVLEHTKLSQRNLISSLYNSSTIAGILMASLFVTLASNSMLDVGFWRIIYWSGGVCALFAVLVRYQTTESSEFATSQAPPREHLGAVIKKNRKALLGIICVAGFSYTTYAIPLTMMNGFIPLITSLSLTEVMQANTFLLALDMVLLPYFGYLATRFSKEKIMLIATLVAVVSGVPLFLLLQAGSLSTVVFVRLFIVIVGVAFSACYHSWAQELVSPHHRYTIISLGHALGSQLIGTPSAALSLWLFHKTGWVGSPAFYFMGSAALAGGCILYLMPRAVPRRELF